MGLGTAEISFTVLDPEKVPVAEHPRWAVLGRSNVGKSSFLNFLTHPKSFFRTSRVPGKTIGLVAAQVMLGKGPRSALELVDVPGFGFSQSSDPERWELLMVNLRERSRDAGLQWIWLADPSREPGSDELRLRDWLNGEPYVF